MYIRIGVGRLSLHLNRLKGKWYAGTLISMVNSIIGNTVANEHTQGKFVNVYPITAQREAGQSLVDFTDNFGVT